jgi:hypothetical protein
MKKVRILTIFLLFSIATFTSCSIQNASNSNELSNVVAKFNNHYQIPPFYAIHNKSITVTNFPLRPTDLIDINLNTDEIQKINSVKRLYNDGYIIDVAVKGDENYRKLPATFSLKSKYKNWSKELPLGELAVNDDGIIYISEEKLCLMDKDTGDFVWEILYSSLDLFGKPNFTFYVCSDYVIVEGENGYFEISTKKGSYINSSIDSSSKSIRNGHGFVYNNKFYFINSKQELIEYPNTLIMKLGDKIDNTSEYLIDMFNNNVVLQKLSEEGITISLTFFTNFNIFKTNEQHSLSKTKRDSKAIVYPLSDINKYYDINKILEIDHLTALVINKYLIVYSKDTIYALNSDLKVKWKYKLDLDSLPYYAAEVLYADENKVIFENAFDVTIYKTPMTE